MPLYEYRCNDCRQVSTLLVRSWHSAAPVCASCGGANLTKLVSPFAVRRAWGESLDWVPSSETVGDVDRDDSRSLGAFMDNIQGEMGGQVSPDFQQMRREIADEAAADE